MDGRSFEEIIYELQRRAAGSPAQEEVADRGFFGGLGSRVKQGINEGGVVGGLAGIVADPNEPSGWFGPLSTVGRQVGNAYAAGYSDDPTAMSRLRLAREESARQDALVGIELATERRRQAMLEQLSGIDPRTPEGQKQAMEVAYRHGEFGFMKDIGSAYGPGAPHPKVETLYDEQGLEYKAAYMPGDPRADEHGYVRIGGTEAPDGANVKLAHDIAAARIKAIGGLLMSRDTNYRVIGMLDRAMATNNPAEAIAGVRSFIAAVDNSVVRSDETKQFFASVGVLGEWVQKLETAKGDVARTALVGHVRAAAANAYGELNKLIAVRDEGYRAQADSAGIPWNWIEAGGSISAPVARKPAGLPE